MRAPVRLLLAAVAVTGLAVVALMVLDPFAEDAPPDREEPFRTTPLEELETTALTVPRAGFCADVDPRQVEAALGAEPVDAQGYDNGEEVLLPGGATDVAHEFGCSWSAASSSQARAWVFAPPVDADRARRLVREAEREQGCESSPMPAFGSPSVGVVCAADGGGTASYQGLFGDAWLTCELSLTPEQEDVSPTELRERTGAWCVGVAMGASGS